MRSSRRGQSGGTLIEVLVSLALVIIGLLGVYSAFTASVRATSYGQRATQATARAERQLELLRNAPATAITCLAHGGTASSCASACCLGLTDGGANCSGDGGVAKLCDLTPTDAPEMGVTYTYAEPVVKPDPTLPDYYIVEVKVSYASPGEAMGGGATPETRTVVLKTALYKPL